MIPLRTVALAPHCDDLAFSIGGALCDGPFGPLLPVAVFTVSAYTASGDGDPGTVTPLRKEEERAFFGGLPGLRPPLWLDRLDAPLRLGIGAKEVRTQLFDPGGEWEGGAVAAQLLPLLPPGADLLAPLALGGHIDHRIVRRAALRLAAGRTLLLYEDLPYGGEMPMEEIEAEVEGVASLLGRPPEPLLLPSPSVEESRKKAVACYRSQTDGKTLEELMRHPRRLAANGVPAERVWKFACHSSLTPDHSSRSSS